MVQRQPGHEVLRSLLRAHLPTSPADLSCPPHLPTFPVLYTWKKKFQWHSCFPQKSGICNSHFHEDNLLYTTMNLFAGGTDTTATTLRWGLLLMAKYPQIQSWFFPVCWAVVGLNLKHFFISQTKSRRSWAEWSEAVRCRWGTGRTCPSPTPSFMKPREWPTSLPLLFHM